MKTVNVTIQGITGILMNKFPMEPVPGREKMLPAQQAEYAAYRTPAGDLYVPGEAVRQSLVAAAAFSKGKGRASLQKTAAAAIFINPEYCLLGQTEYQIDARPIVIPSTGGRVIRYRPRLDEWRVSFDVEYDEVLLAETQVSQVVDDAGQRVGLLDFRPQKRGPFGRFVVVNWSA